MSCAVSPAIPNQTGGLLRQRQGFRAFVIISGIDELASQMAGVAAAWHVYAAAHAPVSLAYLGLVRFLPNILLSLPAGHLADRQERRAIVGLSLCAQAVCMAILGFGLAGQRIGVGGIYALVACMGAAHAFSFPAMSALQPAVGRQEEFPRAVAVSSSVFQVCALAGPAVGGLLYGISPASAFLGSAVLYIVALAQIPALGNTHNPAANSAPGDGSPLAGIRYIRSNRLLLSVISLDLFAVLLGGVTALLPIYAKDILATGPLGMGCLRSAPGIGAALTGIVLARRLLHRSAGKVLLACVGGFGAATVVFAVSRNFWLSLAALGCAGAFDMVAMVMRQTLVQVVTPDVMRGRVSAVQWMFIGASSELGEFESGMTAALLGTVPAALLGGLGTLAIVGLWARIFPELRSTDQVPIT